MKLVIFLLSLLVQLFQNGVLSSDVESCNATTNSYLWRVRTDPPLYLFGTMHIPYTLLWEHTPTNVKTALHQSNNVWLELKLTERDTLANLSSCQYLDEGQRLSQVITQDTFNRITNYLKNVSKLIPIWMEKERNPFPQLQSKLYFEAVTRNWLFKRPIWILVILSSLTQFNLENRNIPLFDIFLDNGASRLGKNVSAAETVNDQCNPLKRLNHSLVEVALRKQLDILEPLVTNSSSLQGTTEQDAQVYRCGDFERLTQYRHFLPLPTSLSNVTREEQVVLDNLNDFLYKQLFIRRNRKITKKIQALLGQRHRNDTYFIALGAGHLIGHKSIVHMLQKKNFIVERLSVHEKIPGPTLPDNFESLGNPPPAIMQHIQQTQATTQPTVATLSPQVIEEIFNRVNSNSARSVQESPQSVMTVVSTGITGISLATDMHVMTTRIHPDHAPNTSGAVQLHSNYLIIMGLIVVWVWSRAIIDN